MRYRICNQSYCMICGKVMMMMRTLTLLDFNMMFEDISLRLLLIEKWILFIKHYFIIFFLFYKLTGIAKLTDEYVFSFMFRVEDIVVHKRAFAPFVAEVAVMLFVRSVYNRGGSAQGCKSPEANIP
uniref:Uncharacterized protein n=1 Tax=Glossina brevipalpis TaxID=37001 RepID=A0A1A9VZW6_9MUSC